MAGYQQSVSGTNPASPYFQPVNSEAQSFDPELPPGLEAQLRPGETGVEYYKRMGIPLPPGFGEKAVSDAPQGRRRNIEKIPVTDEIPEPPQPRQPVSREEDWLMGPPEEILRQAPPVDPRTVGAIEGAPWFERLKASVLFDDISTENWLRDRYSDENVFRDDDDALYFLPPNEAKKPVEARVWVRFNPEGLDTGDLVAFVPGVTAGLLASAAAGLTGGAGVLGTMGAAALGGVGGEAITQTAGALMSDESHVTPMDRATRLALAGTVEGATAGIGGLATEGVKRGARAVSSQIGRAGKAIAESGADPAEMALRREVIERTGFPATVGMETGSPGVLVGERLARQNVMTASIGRKSDLERDAFLREQIEGLLSKAHKEGGRAGTDAAVNAHNLRLEYLVKDRSEQWNALFDAAKQVAGEREVVETTNIRRALSEMLRTETSHLPPGDADAIIASMKKGLDRLGKGKATISQLKNALAQYNRIVYDGRGLSDKIASPKVQKAIARKVMDALRADLSLTIRKSRNKSAAQLASRIEKLTARRQQLAEAIEKAENRPHPVVSGLVGKARKIENRKLAAMRSRYDAFGTRIRDLNESLEANSKASEAASLLDEARKKYASLSSTIDEVVQNPIASYEKNPEGLINEIFSPSGDDRRVKAIMTFLDRVSPDAADRLRARAIEHLIEKSPNVASSTMERVTTSADKLATAAVRNRNKIAALLEGNKQAKQAFSDLVMMSKMIKDRGPHYGSQTAAGNFVNWLTALGGIGVAGTSAYLNKGFPADLIADIGKMAAAVLSSRAIARGLFRPSEAPLYRKLFNMMRVANPGPGTRKAAIQALLDLRRGYAGYSQLEDEESRQSMKDVPESVRRALMLAPGEL